MFLFLRKRFFFTLAILTFVATPTPATAQNEPLVLSVSVVNDNDRAIPPLNASNFSVLIDKEPQTVVSLNSGNVPASVGILVDISGSLTNQGARPPNKVHRYTAEGIDRLFQLSNPQNEYFVAAFHSKPGIVHDWTTDARSIRDKLLALESQGQSALYDGLYKSIEYVNRGHHRKRVIILVSDGVDNASKRTFKEVREFLKNSDVVLYAIGVFNDVTFGSALGEEGESILAKLCEVSGGRVLILKDALKVQSITEAFELIGIELRSQYQLSIDPQTVGPRKWRKLKLKASYVDSSGKPKDVKVRTREGFYR